MFSVNLATKLTNIARVMRQNGYTPKKMMAIAGGSSLTGASLGLAIGEIFDALQDAQNADHVFLVHMEDWNETILFERIASALDQKYIETICVSGPDDTTKQIAKSKKNMGIILFYSLLNNRRLDVIDC
uniref:SIS domain-containing protein n=1 Tax=Acrobeloides nanus TaxID=290746 RepID=A0A914DST8_9BILA